MNGIIQFNEFHNVLFSSLICLAGFGVFFRANKLYLKTSNIKVAIIAIGFLIGAFFELFHTGYSYINGFVQYNKAFSSITFIYLCLSNISFSASIFIALIYSPSFEGKGLNLKRLYGLTILFIISVLAIMQGLESLNPDLFFRISERIIVNNSGLEILDNALYILSAFLYVDIGKLNNKKILSPFLFGLIILGIFQLYVITPHFLKSFYRFYIHISKLAGILLVLFGLKEILKEVEIPSFRYKLITYPALMLMGFYLFFLTARKITDATVLSLEMQYVFIFFFIAAIIIEYFLSNRFTSQIRNAIKHIESYAFEESPSDIPITNNDEIGMIIRKLNESTALIRKNNYELLVNQKQILESTLREKLLRKINEEIRKNLDINQVKNTIVKEIATFLKADRCHIRLINPKNNEFLALDEYSEYLSNPDNRSLIGVEPEKSVFNYLKKSFESNKLLIVPDRKSILNLDKDAIKPINYIFDTLGVKSLYGFPIFYLDKLTAAIVVIYDKEVVKLSNNDLTFMQDVANQAAITLFQSKLYEKVKKNAEREALLRKITETIRNSLDIDVIQNNIVTEVGKTFNADRCFIRLFYPADVFFPIGAEYLSSPDIKSSTSRSYSDEFNDFVMGYLGDNNPLIITDIRNIIEGSDFNPEFKQFLADLDVKSNYGVPIFNNNKLLGALVIQYTKQPTPIDEETIELLNMIANQAGIAIHQAKMFNTIKQIADHEKLLKEIIALSKSDFDIKETLNIVCKKICDVFGVQRIALIDFKGLVSKDVILFEYKLGGVKSPDETNTPYYGELNAFWKPELIDKGKATIINNLAFSNVTDRLKLLYENIGVKSIFAIPLKVGDNKWGGLFLYNYHSQKIWTEREINTLEVVKEHISIAIREKNLYSQQKFLTNISHELKTPIAIINSYTEALINRDKNKSEMGEKFLGIIKNNVDRITNIIDDLLYLASFEYYSENEKQEFALVELGEVISSSIELCQEKAESKNIKINVDFNKPAYANVNSLLIQQALINLINNALKYSEDNTNIFISLEEITNKALIKIQDQGCGIEEEEFENIFKRFYRIDKSRSRETGGFGLGLSIVKKIIEFHGGRIDLSSKLGEGTTFTIQLVSSTGIKHY